MAKVSIHYSHLRIHIEDILHLSIEMEKIVGLQSWKDGRERFHVDYYLKEGPTIQTWYTDENTWKSILEQLSKIGVI